MRPRNTPDELLRRLSELEASDSEGRKTTWRQVVAALGHQLRVLGPPPLDGISGEVLVAATEVAVSTGLIDDLDWISKDSAAIALYELASALPAGAMRRELGRRMLERVFEGTASTFASVATRMVLTPGRVLEQVPLRARVSLVLDLPVGAEARSDALALALALRPDTRRRWLIEPSTGALPARRLAARALERATREALMADQEGDPYPARALVGPQLLPTLELLLADREPLVWRHAAVARGLLTSSQPTLATSVENGLDPALSPTEWRRAAVSLVASCVAAPEDGPRSVRALLQSDLVTRDPGLTATMVWGLSPVVESEPDVAESLLAEFARSRRADVAEAVAGLLAELQDEGFGASVVDELRGSLRVSRSSDSPSFRVVTAQALRQLDRVRADQNTVHAGIRQALDAFQRTGARAAYQLAQAAVQSATKALVMLRAYGGLDENLAPEVLTLLGDLDGNVLERQRLAHLLQLSRRPGDKDASVPEIEALYEGIGEWALALDDDSESGDGQHVARLITQRRLRTILHLVDLDTANRSASEEALGRVRQRVRDVLDVLRRRLADEPESTLHRLLCATLSRTFDAAIREEVAEPCEPLLLTMSAIDDPRTVATLAEASTDPRVSTPLRAWGRFLAAEDDADEIPDSSPSAEQLAAARVVRLSHGLETGGSYRGEALRQTLLRLGRALEVVARARGLSTLTEAVITGRSVLEELEAAVADVVTMIARAHQRVLERPYPGPRELRFQGTPLSGVIDRTVRGIGRDEPRIRRAIAELVAPLPHALSEVTQGVLLRLPTLSTSSPSSVVPRTYTRRQLSLPDWLLPRRTIGSFYVVRALGSGGVASVLEARRVDERHDWSAQHFALKVPHYDPNTARSLSEQQFYELFKDEAGALLSLPKHENLAGFVTFDMSAKPKPILVMELIRGVSVDWQLRSRALTSARCLRILDGILAGLCAMHAAGVGHLDIKPSNIILRPDDSPVLVDFGLSGRHLRPGCGTLEYTAPEILGVVPEGYDPTPPRADVYAFAATAFELLTAKALFLGEDETELVAAHVGHDGWPPNLAELAHRPGMRELSYLLASCLRRDPRDWPSARYAREALGKLAPELQAMSWPLGDLRGQRSGVQFTGQVSHVGGERG